VGGLLTSNNVATWTRTTTEKAYLAGGMTINGSVSGTVVVDFTGGTVTSAGSAGTGLGVSYRFAGTVLVTGTILHPAASTISYVSGTVTHTGTLLFLTGVTTTFDTNGITWNIIESRNSNTFTISSTLNAATFLISANNCTFAGTAGFTVGTFSVTNTTVTTIAFKESITYTITTALSCSASRVGSIVLFTSSHGTTRANIVLPNNGTVTCTCLASFTRIDASGGRTINTFNGVCTDCVNVREFHDRQIYSKGS